jgi:hypothetical protein
VATPDDGATNRWAGLAVGLSVATILGLFGLLIYLLRKQPAQALSSPPIYMLNGGGGGMGSTTFAPLAPTPVVGLEPTTSMSPTFMQTYALPPLGNLTGAARLATASDAPYNVTVRVVGPAGAFAAFSSDATELNRGGVNVPTGQTVIVQSGQEHKIRLMPGQAVFGVGHAINPGETVYVSVSGYAVGTQLYH